jgi:hypothetical protein
VAANESGFVALGLAAVYLGLLGVIVCVLAEMRHRRKGTRETQDCGRRVGSVRIYRLNIRQLRTGSRARPGATLRGWRLQWGGPCRTYSLTWRVADRANW